MTKLTSFLTAGALVLFMGGCAPSTNTVDFFTAPPKTASVAATASPDPATTQPTDAPVDISLATLPPEQDSTQAADTATEQSADTTQVDDTSSDQSADTAQPADSSDDPSAATTKPKATSTPAPTHTPKPTASLSADPSATGSAASGKILSVKKITGTAQVSGNLSLRSSASSTAKILSKIPKDGKFTITGVAKDSTWLKVTYSGQSGYVLAKYVLVNGSSVDKVCMAISSGTLNVRSGAGTTHKLLGVLNTGTAMVVTNVVKASPDNWYKVLLSGTTGYVDAKYCRIAS